MRLIVAEKAIAAKRIADILSSGSASSSFEGRVPVYNFVSNGSDTVVVPLRGHVVEVDYPKQLNNWQGTSLETLVDAEPLYVPSAKMILRVLGSYAKKADEIIVATDYDTEGESIGREAVRAVDVSPKAVVRRAKFSSITGEEILDAFRERSLSSVDDDLADACDARREIDLMWGAVLTRFVSLSSGRLGNQFLSVGRVQSPVLSLVVDREKERRAFKPEPFWVVSALLAKDSKEFSAVHEREKFWKLQEALDVLAKKTPEAVVKDVEAKKLLLKPPTPFNTTDFLRAAANVGVGPERAMNVAESLYMNGFISYPRTDNTVYPSSLNFSAVLKRFENHRVFGELAKKLLAKKKLVATRGKKKSTDHPPIHPVQSVEKTALSPLDWKIYELVVRRFFATLSEVAELDTLKVSLDIGGETFVARGKRVSSPGWKEFYPYSKTEEVFLPQLEKGEKVSVKDLMKEDKETTPPKKYTPAALIKAMDDLGLGTKSTRHTIIGKLESRGYLLGDKSFEPSESAFGVVSVLEDYVSDITKPDMTSKLEKEMARIEEGRLSKNRVVGESRGLLSKVLGELNENKEKISEALRKSLRDEKVLAKCPKCGGDLRVIRSRASGKRFLGCSSYPKCTNSYPLPGRGRLHGLDKECEVCGSPMISVDFGKGRPLETCVNMNCSTKDEWKRRQAEKKQRAAERQKK